MSSSEQIEKGLDYNNVKEYLEYGLVTSEGETEYF